MARLFVTPRELNFISDIVKEIVKDVVGQVIHYYPVSENMTRTHGVYDEAIEKVFDAPIVIDALVDSHFQSDTKIDSFGVDSKYRIEAYVQYRDLVAKGINVSIGDFFSFGDILYEITEKTIVRNIAGFPEHHDGVKLIGTKARDGQFNPTLRGPTDVSLADPDAVKRTFIQQRGRAENAEGVTGDVRDLVDSGVLEPSLGGPREVSERGALADDSHYASSFYDEDGE